ncbi:hypothetical protein ASPWEDRAFT_478242 [Aspergillus wentii DTO 134E9]|uniref:Crh-like protein n=1 Tax=Aspergillus wentii DTO 134E9 TaxID=1073089 RepID=A0A1L9RIS5_ASPWE|nr:uncharacterized protein ASPWEDRAFT_478242 [Aspergillus wentii DTO 134E9]KAI9932214.1 copper resistance protein [Aspergillus wentii]OJJ34824.1 hypothetical protein ASPWEDRAFT_478242 [Aspergillus wentii DTO 134E9]
MLSYLKYAAALAAVLPLATAQTSTDCDPLKKTCPDDDGLDSSTFSTDFTKGDFSKWTTTAGNVTSGSQGAEFTINKKGDAPTIDTDFYFFYGKVDVKMKAAPGTGIVSSIVLESDDLDEVDWEAVGGDTTQIETNYFGKGDDSSYDRATWVTVSTPQDTFHTYSIDWKEDVLTWAIDGNTIRTLNYKDAKDGSRYPQTPMRVRIGIWAGGDSSNNQGTIEWAGGQTDYSQAPFTMYIESVDITNYNPASSYSYSDNSGSSDSIKSSNSSSSSTTRSSSTTSSSSSSTDTSASTTDSSSTATGTSDSATSTETPSGSSSGSSSDSGASSTTGSSSGAGSSTSSSPSSSISVYEGAAASTGAYLGSAMLMAMMTAMLQLV